MKFLSVCEVCLQSYYLEEGEVYIPSNMHMPSKKKNPYIETWGDWLLHIQSHCPMCRVACPARATDDLERAKVKLQAQNREITKEDDDILAEIEDL